MINIESLLSLAEPHLADVIPLPNGRMTGAIIISPVSPEETLPNNLQEHWIATLAIACLACPYIFKNGKNIEDLTPGSGTSCKGIAARVPVRFFDRGIVEGQIQANLKANDGIVRAFTHYCVFPNVSYDNPSQIEDLSNRAPCHARVNANNGKYPSNK
jgi:hypothetical protein